MASKATMHTERIDSEGRRLIQVKVQHRDTDSFTRSVDPAATRYMRSGKAGTFQHASLIDGDYAHDEQFAAHDPRPWCISTITFHIDR